MADTVADVIAGLKEKAKGFTRESERLLTRADAYYEAADVLEKQLSEAPAPKPQKRRQRGLKKKAAKKPSAPPVSEGGRLGQLTTFLETAGPSTAKEIMRQTGIPSGTLTNLFQRGGFTKDAEGRWVAP